MKICIAWLQRMPKNLEILQLTMYFCSVNYSIVYFYCVTTMTCLIVLGNDD